MVALQNIAHVLYPTSHPSLPQDPSVYSSTLEILSVKFSNGKGLLSCYCWSGSSHLQITFWCQPTASGPAVLHQSLGSNKTQARSDAFTCALWVALCSDWGPFLQLLCYSSTPHLRTGCVRGRGERASIVLQCSEFFTCVLRTHLSPGPCTT